MQTTLGSALHYSQQNKNIIANLIIKPYALKVIEAGAKSRCSLDSTGGKEKNKLLSLRHTEDTYILYKV